MPGNGFVAALATDDSLYPIEDVLQAPNLANFDEPFVDGRVLCNVLGCPSTFTRLDDRNRHVESNHVRTPHFCLLLGCEKGFGKGFKGYTRQDKVREHMRKKHMGPAHAMVQG
jgi:hypothetical protein